MRLRSLLFVPGDRPERFPKALASGADALILDLEDSVAPDAKPAARDAIARWLARPIAERGGRPSFVRVNPIDGDAVRADVDALRNAPPEGLVLPKAEGAPSVRRLTTLFGAPTPPILPIATETPLAVFRLGDYVEVSATLSGLTWGAEDLPAAIGAISARTPDGAFTSPYEIVRALTLFAAHAATTAAIETVYPDIADLDGLKAYVARARRDGFTGMMAVHPSQVATINAGFTPSAEEVAQARRVITAFAHQPGVGALRLDGRMIDRPHLLQAQRIIGQQGSSEF